MEAKLPPGFAVPVPDDVQKYGAQLGRLIKDSLPAGWGFGLFLFTYGEGGTMFWLSSAEREDMIRALLEWLKMQGTPVE